MRFMTELLAEHWLRFDGGGLLPWSFTWGANVSTLCSCNICIYSVYPRSGATHLRYLSEIAHTRGVNTTLGSSGTRGVRKGVPDPWLDSDGLWYCHFSRLLSWRQPRTMSCSLHHGKFSSSSSRFEFMIRIGEWLYCVWYRDDSYVDCRGSLDKT